MEAKELRIGNLFRFISTNYIEYVSEIKTNGLKTPVINNVSIKDTEPIPLTEEWLVKFGFTCHWDDDYDNHIFSLIRDGNDDVIIDPSWVSQTECDRFVIAHFDYEMDLEIKHVHQLQNLYFALTNEELKI